MANVPLSRATDLALFEGVILGAAKVKSLQEAQIARDELIELVHRAIVMVRTIGRRLLDRQYVTTVSVTETSLQIDISTLQIIDLEPRTLVLWDSLAKVIPILPSNKFYELKNLYSTALLADAVLAHIDTETMGADTKAVIKVYRGANVTTPGTQTLTYYRMPTKAILADTKIDLPDDYMPIAQDVATLMLMRRLSMTPPSELENRVVGYIQTQGIQAKPEK